MSFHAFSETFGVLPGAWETQEAAEEAISAAANPQWQDCELWSRPTVRRHSSLERIGQWPWATVTD